MCDDRGRCQMHEFVQKLEADDRADFVQVVALLRRTALMGPPKDERKSRPLDDHIYELKTGGGIRIPYFFDAGRVIICTEAVKKPKKNELRTIIERAAAARCRYLQAKRANAIRIDREGP